MVDKEIVQIKTREVYHLLLVKDIDLMTAHKLFSQVYNVIWYRYKFQHVNSPEAESLARWSLEDARNILDDTLRKLELCDLDKSLVRYIANNCEFEKV